MAVGAISPILLHLVCDSCLQHHWKNLLGFFRKKLAGLVHVIGMTSTFTTVPASCTILSFHTILIRLGQVLDKSYYLSKIIEKKVKHTSLGTLQFETMCYVLCQVLYRKGKSYMLLGQSKYTRDQGCSTRL
jgi:hypothetical protein